MDIKNYFKELQMLIRVKDLNTKKKNLKNALKRQKEKKK